LKYWLPVVLIALFVSSSMAQTNAQVEKARMELERTDELIERAKEAVRATNAPLAAVVLKQAIEIQHKARERFHQRQLLWAYKQTLEARELAKKALIRCRLTEQGETVVQRKLERAAELLERAKESTISGSEGRLRAIYESAKDNLNRAWEFYRSNQYRPALKLANQVTKAAREILKAANRQMRQYAEFERLSESVGDLIARVREKVINCGSEEALRLVERADKMNQLALKLGSEDKFNAAVRNLQNARKMAVEASKKCNGTEALSRRYDRIKSEIDRLAEEISPDNDAARRLLNQVYDQLRLAEDFITEKQTEAAAAALKAAQLTLNQLKKHLSGTER